MATLTVTKTGALLNLMGRVFDDQGQIDCGVLCGSDTGTYPVGTVVVLTAQPGILPFQEWSGACSGSSSNCTVVMNGNKSVTARFGLLLAPPSPPVTGAQWTSRLEAPSGTGTVTINGAATGSVGRAPATIPVPDGGEVRVQGVLATASGPGTWRFERSAGSSNVQLKVLEGQVSLVTQEAVVFRLRGQPGERVAFVIVPLR